MTHFLYFTPMLIEYNLCVLRNLLLKVKYTTKELYIYNKKRSPKHFCSGLLVLKEGGILLSHIALQYHRRNRA